MDIKIIFPDKKELNVKQGITAGKAISLWNKEAVASTIAVKVNGIAVDISRVLDKDATIALVDISSEEGLNILRNSISRVMAHAVQDVFAGAKVSIGPSIEDGFYYDFEYAGTFTNDDFPKIEKRMREIIAADYPFVREEMTRQEAVELFASRGEDYKVELINDLPSDVSMVSIYKDGNYIDLCRGPHIPSTGKIKAFKLLRVAGGFWRGGRRKKIL